MLIENAKIYVGMAVAFLGLDMLWLGVVAKGHYQSMLGHMMRERPLWPAALAFYGLYILGILVFVVRPALVGGSLLSVLGMGALYGLIAYATFDLTALALLSGFPAGIVAVDLCWGAVITGTTSVLGWLLGRALGAGA